MRRAAAMLHRMRIGMLTPSSNIVLEPATAAMLAQVPGVSAHFSRFRVTAIDLGDAALGQFETAPILAAADLLADARVDAICWNGTSGSWLGLDRDQALCDTITARTGVPATTATLALRDALACLAATRIGLVTPYLGDVQSAIVARFASVGIDVVDERHLDDPGNFSFAEHASDTVARLVREAAGSRPQAIAIHCTNFRGWEVAAGLEDALGIPVLDSVAVTLWGGLRAAGIAPAPLRRWGQVFALG